MKIALVTFDDFNKYPSAWENEDNRLIQYLKSRGFDARLEIWTDPQVNWQSYDLVILKSPWDYFDKISLFEQWLTTLEQQHVRLLNPVKVVRWNSDKHYLSAIAAAGLPVIQSLYLEKGQQPDLLPYFEMLGTEKLIVKPCVSGGAKNTFALSRETLHEATSSIHRLLQEESFLVQPFLPQIQWAGEWSFVYFNGKFSHCLLKKARSGDFRVQHYLGGTVHLETPPPGLLEATSAFVAQFAQGCLYARVDGVMVENQFLLMELELIEPFLFLHTHPESYENYIRALRELL